MIPVIMMRDDSLDFNWIHTINNIQKYIPFLPEHGWWIVCIFHNAVWLNMFLNPIPYPAG